MLLICADDIDLNPCSKERNSWYVFSLCQLTITCSKSIIETLQKGVKYVQS